MKIRFNEMIMASRDIEATNQFYQKLFKQEALSEHHDFFYTLQDQRSTGNLAIVPHNGEKRWDHAWLSVMTDDLNNAKEYIQNIGAQPDSFENFGPQNKNGEFLGFTFKDPDDRVVMVLQENFEM